MSRKIVSISFLFEDQRIRIGCDKKGKFPLPKIKRSRLPGDSLSYMHPYTAKAFGEQRKVRNADPGLTLSDGTKIRVYLNGDPTGPVVEAMSVIENHDESSATRTKLLEGVKKRVKINTKKAKANLKNTSYIDDYDFGFDYPFDFDDGMD